MLGGRGAADAENGYWEPPGIHPSDTPLATVFAKARDYAGASTVDYADRVERYAVSANGITFDAVSTVHGDDFAVRATIDGETYSFGRSGGNHWRQTPRGLVHLVRSDVQGDDLDRWPTAALPLSARCIVAGETQSPAAWVLLDRREGDIPHWFYVDERSGAIVREITREGRRVETTTFDDARAVNGVTRPFHWHVDGPGGALDVHVTAVEPQRVEAAAAALPHSATDTFPHPVRAQNVPSTFDHDRIFVTANVEGTPLRLLLDTGTPQIVVGEATARKLHKRVVLGHTTLRDVAVGDLAARSVPAGVVGENWVQGILGYDFFAGRIVHIDYEHARVETLPRESFTAPSDARTLESPFDEGMPVVPARVGDVASTRFVLDTGSARIVILDGTLRRAHRVFADLDASALGGARTIRFLEGPIDVERAALRSLILGGQRFSTESADMQTHTTRFDAEFPIDGIIGTDLLSHLEWWFDADGGRTWFRWQR
ncbi:MAG: hypothetical protein M3R53_02840 [Candidatus Eremiobacteraeota bacterium]|nr:hypothetical protein [Candidatus Eremiobacteraeota bacterium]